MKYIFCSVLKCSVLLFLCLLHSPNHIHCQDHLIFNSARGLSLSNCYTTFTGHQSLFSNPAGLAGIQSPVLSCHSAIPYNLSELSMSAVALSFPLFNKEVFAGSFVRFGLKEYHEDMISIKYARKLFPKLSAALSFHYIQSVVTNLSRQGNVTFDMGVIYNLNKKIQIGWYLFNPQRATAAPNSKVRTDNVLSMGMNYLIAKNSKCYLEIHKTNNHSPSYHSGIDYQITDMLNIRAGMGANPQIYAFGTGLLLEKLKADFAFSYNAILGFTPSLNLTFKL